ncbi:MAG TPA: BTAD domain-containing putative transcriptional regulator, partial [Thermomonospora sp.]|nr:BTAD domain-containing putative transcriptional regulator [Thermomonospora sp.]
MRFGVLGPLAVWDGDGCEVPIPEAKVRVLLASLLAREGGPVPADRLAEDLWAGAPPGNPANTLQTKISRLRQVVGRDRLVHRPSGYLLRPGTPVDAQEFEELAGRARRAGDPATRARLCAEALALWRGPAYADVADAPFARAEIARLEELRLAVLEEQAEARLELGEHAVLAAELGALVARHPLRERLRTAHLRALALTGRQGDALAAFHDLRRRLDEELGVEPGPAVAEAYQEILRGVPATPPRRRGNLPVPVTPLVGREREVPAVRDALADARLVTLTGPGGVGKTRLAIAAARDLTGRFPDGVWLVELAGLAGRSTPDDVAERVIAAVGLCDTAAVDPEPVDLVDWLCGALADRRVLLLLDNGEHVVDALAALAARLL